jgi:aryl-alcohol dehydrogenase-like predicted oxidoreductase
MDRSILGPSVSPLGFGCVQLTAQPRQSEAVAILERAFSLGITHFDVARAYGFGRAEGILAQFLRGRRDQVTVATKFGFQMPSGLAGNPRLISAAKRLLGPFPALLRRAQRRGSAMVKAGAFSPEAAVQSLEASLRVLQTDYIDILLLHEATLADAASEALLDALQKQVTRGTVRHLGIASAFPKLEADARRLSATLETVQFDDNAQNRNLEKLANREQRLLITHSIFKPAAQLRDAVKTFPQAARESSHQIGAELTDLNVIASLLLHYALRTNVAGIVLFSTTNPAHLEANVREAQSRRFDDLQLKHFVAFVDKVLGATNNCAPRPSATIQAKA